MQPKLPRPPYDAELAPLISQFPFDAPFSREILGPLREFLSTLNTAATTLAGKPVSHVERSISGPGGDITLSIIRSTATSGPSDEKGRERPGIYMTHGGGMISGNRFLGMSILADWVVDNDAVGISVEYRLAPEHPDPAPIEDCYAGLKWVGENLSELGIDPKRLMIAGMSAGGGLAAGVALLIRDRGGPSLCGQVLSCPMLDDRNESVSSMQYVGEKIWDRQSNIMGWTCLLGEERCGSKDVSIYAAPGRATDLSGLPPAFIEVGSAETFRDEDVAYASLLWASGVQAELHVWPGGFHGFDSMAPDAVLSQLATKARASWVQRTLSPAKAL